MVAKFVAAEVLKIGLRGEATVVLVKEVYDIGEGVGPRECLRIYASRSRFDNRVHVETYGARQLALRAFRNPKAA